MMKEAIFDAANTVLEEHGPTGLTMDRVAATAGLATGSLYNYFHGKDDLLQYAHARLVEPLFRAITEAAAADVSAPEKLKRIVVAALGQVVEHKALLRLLVGKVEASQVRVDARRRFLQLLTPVFEQGIREGSFRPHNPAHTSRMFQGCLASLFELRADGASHDEVNEYAGLLIDACVEGVSLHAGPSRESERANPSSSPQ